MKKRTSFVFSTLMLLLLALLLVTGCEDEKNSVSPGETYSGEGFPVAIITETPDGEDASDVVAAFRAAGETPDADTPREFIPEVYDVLYTRNNPDATRSFLNSMRDEENRPIVVVGPTTDTEVIRCLDYCEDDPLLFLSPYAVATDHEREKEYMLSFGVDLQHIVNAYYDQMLDDCPILDWGYRLVIIVPDDDKQKARLVSIWDGQAARSGYWWVGRPHVYEYRVGAVENVIPDLEAYFDEPIYGLDGTYIYFAGTGDNTEDLLRVMSLIQDRKQYYCIASPEFSYNQDLVNDANFISMAEEKRFFCLQPSVNMYGGTGDYYNRLEARLHRSADFKAHISHDIHRLLMEALQSVEPAETQAGYIERLRNRIIELGASRNGISGPLEFDDHGDRSQVNFDVLRIHNGQWKSDGTVTGHNLRK